MTAQRQAAFTLLELLVALAVFSLVSVMAYSGLRTVLQSKQLTDNRAARMQHLQSAIMMLERELGELAPRAIRDEYGDEKPFLLSSDYGSKQLEFTHGGWSNPTGSVRSSLQRVAYGVDDEQLVRLSWSVLDRAQDSEPYRAVLLDDVHGMKLRFMDDTHEWQTQWPPQDLAKGDPIPRPIAAEVTLELNDLGDIRRLIPLYAESISTTTTTTSGTTTPGLVKGKTN